MKIAEISRENTVIQNQNGPSFRNYFSSLLIIYAASEDRKFAYFGGTKVGD